MNSNDIEGALHAFHFLRPLWLLALLPLWGLAVVQARRRLVQGNWSGVIDPELLSTLRLEGDDVAATSSPWLWLALTWTLAVTALAGPSWRHDSATGYRASAAWVVVLDLSPSMAATDVAPNRVTRARYAIDDILAAAHDASVGLIVFSDEPYTVTPLTEDVGNVRALLSPLAPDLMPTAGDRLGPALDQAGQLLKKAGSRQERVIVLTDGFADPAAAFDAAERLRSQSVTVDVVGIGTESGAPLVGAAGDFVRGEQGQTVLTQLDTDRLRRLADSGSGRYVDLQALPTLIESLQTQPEEASAAVTASGIQIEHWQDAGIWILPGLLLLAAALARRGWL